MVLREMLVDDLDQVMKIENELFSPAMDERGIFYLSDPQGCHVPCSGRERRNPGLLWPDHGFG